MPASRDAHLPERACRNALAGAGGPRPDITSDLIASAAAVTPFLAARFSHMKGLIIRLTGRMSGRRGARCQRTSGLVTAWLPLRKRPHSRINGNTASCHIKVGKVMLAEPSAPPPAGPGRSAALVTYVSRSPPPRSGPPSDPGSGLPLALPGGDLAAPVRLQPYPHPA